MVVDNEVFELKKGERLIITIKIILSILFIYFGVLLAANPLRKPLWLYGGILLSACFIVYAILNIKLLIKKKINKKELNGELLFSKLLGIPSVLLGLIYSFSYWRTNDFFLSILLVFFARQQLQL